jgi:hypothetical protein
MQQLLLLGNVTLSPAGLEVNKPFLIDSGDWFRLVCASLFDAGSGVNLSSPHTRGKQALQQ